MEPHKVRPRRPSHDGVRRPGEMSHHGSCFRYPQPSHPTYLPLTATGFTEISKSALIIELPAQILLPYLAYLQGSGLRRCQPTPTYHRSRETRLAESKTVRGRKKKVLGIADTEPDRHFTIPRLRMCTAHASSRRWGVSRSVLFATWQGPSPGYMYGKNFRHPGAGALSRGRLVGRSPTSSTFFFTSYAAARCAWARCTLSFGIHMRVRSGPLGSLQQRRTGSPSRTMKMHLLPALSLAQLSEKGETRGKGLQLGLFTIRLVHLLTCPLVQR